jgi:hypothetical protein
MHPVGHASGFATAFSDREAGAMSPFGNLYDVPVSTARWAGPTGSCSWRDDSVTMSVAYADSRRTAGPTVADIAVARSTERPLRG